MRALTTTPNPATLAAFRRLMRARAALFADEPLAAREHFREAARAAADGEALRQEKQAQEAVKRAEEAASARQPPAGYEWKPVDVRDERLSKPMIY